MKTIPHMMNKAHKITRSLALFCSLLMLSLLPLATQAQFVSIGIKGGVGGNFHYNQDNSFNAPSPQVGLFAIYSDQNHLGIGGEVLITEKQATTRMEGFLVETNLLYADIPVLGYYFFGEYGARLRPKVFAGPQLSVKLNEDTPNRVDEDDFRDLDFGVVLGGGLNYRLTRQIWFNGDLRYSAGLIPIQSASGSKQVRNQFVSVLVGLAIGLDRLDDPLEK